MRVASSSSLYEDKMLKGGDVDLNSFQHCTDSLKEILKQKMLNQEVVFTRQVIELHQLYRKQIAMTDDFKQKGFDNNTLCKGSMNNQAKCSMVDILKSENFNKQQNLSRAPGFMQKPLDLHLPVDEFIRQSAYDFSGKGVLSGPMEVSTESNNFSQEKVAFDLCNLNLSLTIGKNTGKKGREHRSWLGKRPCPSSSEIIDLEDPNSSFSNNNAYLGFTSSFAAPETCSRDNNKLEIVPVRSRHKLQGYPQSGIRHISYGPMLSRSLVDVGPSCQRQTLHDSELDGRCRDFVPNGLLSNNKLSSPRGANNLDLNTVPLEDSSNISNNYSMVVNPLVTSLSAVSEKVYPESVIVSSVSPAFWRKSNVNKCAELSDMCLENNVETYLARSFLDNVGGKCSKGCKSGLGNGGEISYIDLDSDSGEELCSSRSDPKIESVGSSSKLLNGLSCELDMVDIVGVQANIEKASEPFVVCQNQKASEQLICHKLCSSSESECMIENHSSSLRTMQSGVKGGDLNFSSSDESQIIGMGPAAAHSGEQDQRSSESSESRIKTKAEEEDRTANNAAELLLQISSETRASYLSGLVKADSKEFQNKEVNQPQRSSESYDAMVLKAKECTPDDYCISSNAFVVDLSENKESRYKLKRGTRMRDFQKDILPSLSTLARYEIREDLNIIEGVIRSREYKKMRARTADGGDWCKSRRSKRSRVVRRNYL